MTRLACLSLLLLPCLSGCVVAVAAAAGAVGYTQYDRNQLFSDFDRDIETTWSATLDAMEELGHGELQHARLEKTEGTIESGDLKVRVERHPGDFTRVIAHYGTFYSNDHKRKASILLETIARHLDVPWPPPERPEHTSE